MICRYSVTHHCSAACCSPRTCDPRRRQSSAPYLCKLLWTASSVGETMNRWRQAAPYPQLGVVVAASCRVEAASCDSAQGREIIRDIKLASRSSSSWSWAGRLSTSAPSCSLPCYAAHRAAAWNTKQNKGLMIQNRQLCNSTYDSLAEFYFLATSAAVI